MSLEAGFSWSYEGLQFNGYSLAGITTSITFKNAGVCFDVGQGLPYHLGINQFLITHGHLDHASGIPYVVSQKNMMSHKQSEFYMPEMMVEPMHKIMQAWEAIEGHSYDFVFKGVEAGQRVELKSPYWAKAFKTPHRVDSVGYLVYERKKKIRPDFANLSREEILDLKSRGEDPNIIFDIPVVAFTGDTRIEFLESDPDIAKSQVLFMEVTFWDDQKDVKNARFWGHTHFYEFLNILPSLKNERIVLIHASARYSTPELQNILKNALSEQDLDRVHLFQRSK